MESIAPNSKAPPINLKSLEIIAIPDYRPFITVAHAIRHHLLELGYHSVRAVNDSDSFEQLVRGGFHYFFDELRHSNKKMEGPITAEFWIGCTDRPNSVTFSVPPHPYLDLVKAHMEMPSDPYLDLVKAHMNTLGEYLKKSGLEIALHSDDFPQPL